MAEALYDEYARQVYTGNLENRATDYQASLNLEDTSDYSRLAKELSDEYARQVYAGNLENRATGYQASLNLKDTSDYSRLAKELYDEYTRQVYAGNLENRAAGYQASLNLEDITNSQLAKILSDEYDYQMHIRDQGKSSVGYPSSLNLEDITDSQLAKALSSEYARQVSAENQEETANNDQLAEALSKEYIRQVSARETFGAFWDESDAVIPGSVFNEEIPEANLNSAVVQESDLGKSVRWVGKSILSAGKEISFEELPKDIKQAFQDSLTNATPDVKELLCRRYSKAKYVLLLGKHSYYRHSEEVKAVELGRNATPSTLAHELFHEIDVDGKISINLSEALMKDYTALNVVSNGDVKGFLLQQYSKAFSRLTKTGEPIMGEAYRGIADILNGLSGGKINYGYGHPRKYWLENGTLESEAWAQFGRTQFENNTEVLNMFQSIFPNLLACAKMTLKKLVRKELM